MKNVITYLIIFTTTVLVSSALEFNVYPTTGAVAYKLDRTRGCQAYGIYRDEMYIAGQYDIAHTPIFDNAPNYTQWTIKTLPISSNIICCPNCGVIFENRDEMYIIGRHMNWGNGENWETLYKSYKIDLLSLSITEMSWNGFTRVTTACVASNNMNAIYVVGGMNITQSHPQLMQIYDVNANTGTWITKQIGFKTQQGSCQYYQDSIYIFPDGVVNLYHIRKLDLRNVNTLTNIPHTNIADIRNYIPGHSGRTSVFSLYSAVDNKIYFGGGLIHGDPDWFFNDVYTINVLDDSFAYLSSASSHLDVAICASAAIVVNTTIKVYGGITGNNIDNAANAYVDIIQYGEIPTATQTAASDYTLPTIRAVGAYGVYNDSLYVVGGWDAGAKIKNIIRTPISPLSSGYGKWETTNIAITNDIICAVNCGEVLTSTNEMYIIGRHMNWGNGENWDLLYKSYKIDLNTLDLTEVSWTGLNPFIRVTFACITSNGVDKIFVVGGLNQTAHALSIIQIYDVTTYRWDKKNIQFTTMNGACEYYNDIIFVFPDVFNQYVRKLNVANLNAITDISDTIIGDLAAFNNPYPVLRSNAFSVYSSVDKLIYWGGGMHNGIWCNDIYTLNVLTDSFEYLSNPESHLDIPIEGVAAVFMVDNIIKVMGGYTGQVLGGYTGKTDLTQYAVIATPTPTKNPSYSPTENPSNSPTKNPSKSPNNPSDSPTLQPTEPTNNPTKSPINNPSKSPTNNPTGSPTPVEYEAGWILKEKDKYNCNDGYEEASDEKYCQPCSDGYVGTSGVCNVKCSAGYEPNDKRDECTLSSTIEWVIVVCTVGPVAIACFATIYAKRKTLKKFIQKKQMTKSNTYTSAGATSDVDTI